MSAASHLCQLHVMCRKRILRWFTSIMKKLLDLGIRKVIHLKNVVHLNCIHYLYKFMTQTWIEVFTFFVFARWSCSRPSKCPRVLSFTPLHQANLHEKGFTSQLLQTQRGCRPRSGSFEVRTSCSRRSSATWPAEIKLGTAVTDEVVQKVSQWH